MHKTLYVVGNPIVLEDSSFTSSSYSSSSSSGSPAQVLNSLKQCREPKYFADIESATEYARSKATMDDLSKYYTDCPAVFAVKMEFKPGKQFVGTLETDLILTTLPGMQHGRATQRELTGQLKEQMKPGFFATIFKPAPFNLVCKENNYQGDFEKLFADDNFAKFIYQNNNGGGFKYENQEEAITLPADVVSHITSFR